MTEKRRVYNTLTRKPKRVALIAEETKLSSQRVLEILYQLAKEGKAVYRVKSTGTGWVVGSGVPPKPAPPLSPPAPPPAKKSRWVNPPWNGKVVYVAWGFEKGDFSPEQLASRAAAARCRSLAIQLTFENDPFQARARAACHEYGLQYLIWERSDEVDFGSTLLDVTQFNPDGYLADVEGPMKDPEWVKRFDSSFPDLPRALCATGALDQAFPGGGVASAAHWVENWDLCMQDYIVHGDTMDPDHAENFAFWRNFPINAAGKRHFPVLEVRAENSPPLADQLHLVAPWGKAFGVYLAEYLTDGDWDTLKSI